MARYSQSQKDEALTLAETIGVKAASIKTGVPAKTIYSWRDREQKKHTILNEQDEPLTPEEMAERIRSLEKELEQSNKDKMILMDALDFFARNRRK